MYFGADYYPEHVSPQAWERDAALMEKAGFNVTRLAEFAWVFMEPEEGRFTFGWLDDAIGTLFRHGIRVILGTPTASMPSWVARSHPESLAMDSRGRRHTWGARKNNCPSSAAYRLLSARITRAMAEHFAASPAVIGWQTDNELGAPFCYCPSCRASFQEWLRKRYGSLDELNRAWGTHFWGTPAGRLGGNPACRRPRLPEPRPVPGLPPPPLVAHRAVPGGTGGSSSGRLSPALRNAQLHGAVLRDRLRRPGA